MDLLNLNAFSRAGGKLIGVGDASSQPSDDFNTTLRTGSNDVGAYRFASSGNPGWTVAPEFKEFPSGGTGSSGDFNSDGIVDGADFFLWQQGYGSTYDASDLADWEANYGTPPAANAAGVGGVPEPHSLFLLTLGAASLLTRSTRKVA